MGGIFCEDGGRLVPGLRDGSGKVRILLEVQSDGTSTLQFVGDSGRVVRECIGQRK
jgi:hypothetical protein